MCIPTKAATHSDVKPATCSDANRPGETSGYQRPIQAQLDRFGFFGSEAGDVNGDGFGDVLFGALHGNPVDATIDFYYGNLGDSPELLPLQWQYRHRDRPNEDKLDRLEILQIVGY